MKMKLTDCENFLKPQLCLYQEGSFMGERRWIHFSPGVDCDGKVQRARPPWVNGCQGQRKKKREMDPKGTFDPFFSFWLKALMWILEGEMAYAPLTFLSFTEFSGFDQHVLHALSLWLTWSLLLLFACWGKYVIFPFLQMRKLEIRGVDLHFITQPGVNSGPKMKNPVLSGPNPSCYISRHAWNHMGNHWLQWKYKYLWWAQETWGVAHLQKEL